MSSSRWIKPVPDRVKHVVASVGVITCRFRTNVVCHQLPIREWDARIFHQCDVGVAESVAGNLRPLAYRVLGIEGFLLFGDDFRGADRILQSSCFRSGFEDRGQCTVGFQFR